jgi:hypothetical protein
VRTENRNPAFRVNGNVDVGIDGTAVTSIVCHAE